MLNKAKPQNHLQGFILINQLTFIDNLDELLIN